MLRTINAPAFLELVEQGIKNLEKHRKRLNDLNVFPVPDGDTGTNMVMTLRYGFESVRTLDEDLPTVSRRLANATSFGARGNSGVILSQFFKGLADGFSDRSEADAANLCRALTQAYKSAYASVATIKRKIGGLENEKDVMCYAGPGYGSVPDERLRFPVCRWWRDYRC